MPKKQLCRNCGHPVEDNYCPSCGQRTTTQRLSWMSLVESVTSTFIGDEAYGLRGINMRKGAVMTWLSILFQPHRVIPEFIEGRRRKYFNPVAILLLLSTFYAVVFLLVGKTHTPLAAEGQPMWKWIFCTYIDYATLHPAGYLLLALPPFALAMKTVFRRKADLRYVEYLYIGIFLSIFEITLMILTLPAELLVPWYSSFYLSTLPSFLFMAFVFWKIFGLRKRGALLRTLLTSLMQYVYIILLMLTLTATLLGGYYLFAPERFKRDFNMEQTAENGVESSDPSFIREVVTEIVKALEDEEDMAEETSPAPADSLRAK